MATAEAAHPRRPHVFRAGYGIYYSPEIAVKTYDLVLNGNRKCKPDRRQVAPVLSTQNGFAQTASTGFPSYFGVDKTAPTAYVQQWTASLQHEFPGAYCWSWRMPVARARTSAASTSTIRRHTPNSARICRRRPGDLQSLRDLPRPGRDHSAQAHRQLDPTNRCK